MPPQLLDLPREILNDILSSCNPQDLGKLSSCCRYLNEYIGASQLLHKQIYTRHYDKSRLIADGIGDQWRRRLQKYTKLLKLLESPSEDVKLANFQFIADTICELLADASCSKDEESRNTKLLADRFHQVDIDSLLCRSALFGRVRGQPRLRSHIPQTPSAQSQSSAKLHCLYGVPVSSARSDAEDSSERGLATRPFAVSRVYDLRNYTTANLWGPFLNDTQQRVDWEMMEAIMVVLGYNLKASRECDILRGVWTRPFSGAMPHSYIADEPLRLLVREPRTDVPTVPKLPSDFEDPYGVGGTWMRIVCFLDYRDLFDYNFIQSVPRDVPRPPYVTEEATRLILMRLRPVGYGEHEEHDDKSRPVVKFIGATLPVHASWDENTHATMRGTVRTTEEGEIRWTSFSVFQGEERWKSEGIQVGGIRSARGVLGTWFDKDFDPHGPAGPTAFWKLSDRDAVDDHGEASDNDSQIFGYEFDENEDN